MRTLFVALGWIVLNWLAQVVTPTPQPVSIIAPLPGAALQGQILIEGSVDLPDFQMAELWYSYSDGTGSFLITQLRQPVQSGELGIWDTTVINDGNYDLHLRVFLTDGSVQEIAVGGLRVRNSTPIETNTPEIEVLHPEITATVPPPTATVRPSATALAPNPAAIQQEDLQTSVLFGVVVAVAGFMLLGTYLGFRKLMRRP